MPVHSLQTSVFFVIGAGFILATMGSTFTMMECAPLVLKKMSTPSNPSQASELIPVSSEEEFTQLVTKGLTSTTPNAAVVHFWADWCAPCFEMDKICLQLAQKYSNVKFYKVCYRGVKLY